MPAPPAAPWQQLQQPIAAASGTGMSAPPAAPSQKFQQLTAAGAFGTGMPAPFRSKTIDRSALSATRCPLAAPTAADRSGIWHRDASATRCPLAAYTAADRRGVWHRDASASCCPLAAVAAADHSSVWHRDASATSCPLAAYTAADRRGVWHRDASASCCPLAAVAAADRSGVWHRDVSATCCPLAEIPTADRGRGVRHRDASASPLPTGSSRSSRWQRPDPSAPPCQLSAFFSPAQPPSATFTLATAKPPIRDPNVPISRPSPVPTRLRKQILDGSYVDPALLLMPSPHQQLVKADDHPPRAEGSVRGFCLLTGSFSLPPSPSACSWWYCWVSVNVMRSSV